jgi:Flp pilus assembly protein TadG
MHGFGDSELVSGHIRLPARRDRGQALVEFSLAVTLFLVLMMGVVDFGSAVYRYNGVSEAAREIARVASVHPGTPVGTSAEVSSVVSTQRGLIPGLGVPTITCVSISGATVTGACSSPNWVSVTITSPYTPVTPLLGLVGTWTMKGSSNAQMQ